MAAALTNGYDAAMRPEAGAPGTADQILDVAERLIQTRGYNGFSYADISAQLGITKASLHYHFRTKADLGRRIIARYTERFTAALDAITEEGAPAPAMLAAYVQLYAGVLRQERLCLCGMLAAEHATLPPAMQAELRHFFDLNEAWLMEVAESGRAAGTLRFDGPARDLALVLLGALEGAMLVARPFDDPARFERAAYRLLATVA
jgi:TetR/AcrR family transcriptional repressor of nem operon